MLVNLSCNTYTTKNNDSIINVNSNNELTTITLIESKLCNAEVITIRKTDSSSNLVTINRGGANTIDGVNSVSLLYQNDYITLVPTNEGYSIIDSNSGTSTNKVKITPEGGIAVKLTNKTGGASVKGEVVSVYSATAINSSVSKIVVDIPAPIGVFYESGVADGNEAWVVISGVADVYFVGNTTRGHLARGFITGDAGYVTGQALSEAVPSSPFASDKHFYEIGHVLESRTGAGLAKCVLHFN